MKNEYFDQLAAAAKEEIFRRKFNSGLSIEMIQDENGLYWHGEKSYNDDQLDKLIYDYKGLIIVFTNNDYKGPERKALITFK